MSVSKKHYTLLVFSLILGFLTYNSLAQTVLDNIPQNDTLSIIRVDSLEILQTPPPDSTFVLSDSLESHLKDSLVEKEKKVVQQVYKTTPVVITDSTQVTYFTESFSNLMLGRMQYIDTALLLASYFDPLDKPFSIYQTLSNAGTAYQPLELQTENPLGFDMQFASFKNYLKSKNNIRFYIPHIPYSEVRYTMGGKKEQQLQVHFGRQFLPRLYISIDYDLSNSPGPYKNNKTNNSRLGISGRYNSKNERFGATAYYFHNKLEIQENGGILHDSIFSENIEGDRRVITVHLNDAENRIKSAGFGAGTYFCLSKAERVIKGDSVVMKSKIPVGRIAYNFDYQRNRSAYYDKSPLSDFYKPFDIVQDSTQTFDSTTFVAIKNRIEWNTLSYQKYHNDIPFYLYVAVEHGYYKSKISEQKKFYSQLTPSAGIIINLFKATRITGNAQLISSGYQSGDFMLHGNWLQYLGTTKKNIGALFFDFKLKNQSQSWFYETYESNHFRWNNNFDQSLFVIMEAGYTVKNRLTVGVGQKTIDKYVFMNKDARPEQIGGTINIQEIYAQFHVPVGKFDFLGFIKFQNSDNEDVLHLPTITSKLKFTFTQPIFKKAATFQPGICINYFTSYYADAYMPALHSFYLQNDVKVGNYPFIDLYIALKIKRANIYIQYSNIYSLTQDFSYYTTPTYPMRDGRFYFGINWRMYR
ncbi:MAG: putative porin [Lentimicrobiaceae bacterium]|jgi:hypothetical protein|nr:putative porin [Lentimicrobiaceae bacterium]